MEDAATAEISWQWIKYGVESDRDGIGVRVEKELFGRGVEEEMERIERERLVMIGKEKFKKGMYKEVRRIFTRQCTAQILDDFLTLDAYNRIVLHYPKGLTRL
ncbi:malate synthase [Pyrus ussuriensis x Pyrus communis]|uniref:Malate synthase n=1 Tax=Pyrus ussuriensis x Pyrus communis TaxID=2448454 RepID=A0A5N5G228_9ROSA|nr:malate synthase [Pyrus ussuriensis x Pyrus communis]